MTSIAVIGAGISGLSAAWFALRDIPETDVTIFEASSRTGGCLKGTTLGAALPTTVDVGAEASLWRRPETRELATELGLGLEHPDPEQKSRVVHGGALHPIPPSLMGVPGDPDALAGLFTEAEIARVRGERIGAPVDADMSVGDFVAGRLGDAVVDRLVDPLLGGVYAGNARLLSLRATVPALWTAARAGSSVLDAAKAPQPSPGVARAPVFMGIDGGINRLAAELTDRLQRRGAAMELDAPVTAVHPGGIVDTPTGPRCFDAVILALPAHAAALVVADSAPDASRALGSIGHASSAVVTALVEAPGEGLSGSGFLVPPPETEYIKAATFSSNKWPWLRRQLPAGTELIRTSAGRYGDRPDWLDGADEEIASRSLDDLRRITGHDLPVIASHVQRWPRSLPQYAPGHIELVEAIDRAIDDVPGLALTGAAFGGVGIPACLARSAETITRLRRDLAR